MIPIGRELPAAGSTFPPPVPVDLQHALGWPALRGMGVEAPAGAATSTWVPVPAVVEAGVWVLVIWSIMCGSSGSWGPRTTCVIVVSTASVASFPFVLLWSQDGCVSGRLLAELAEPEGSRAVTDVGVVGSVPTLAWVLSRYCLADGKANSLSLICSPDPAATANAASATGNAWRERRTMGKHGSLSAAQRLKGVALAAFRLNVTRRRRAPAVRLWGDVLGR